MRPTSRPNEDVQTILVVDDTPENVVVLGDCLEDLGFLVVVAYDGEEAIKRAQFAHPDLILLDVMMPKLNGYDTCRRLKEIEETEHIPVIFLSSLSDLDDKLMGFSVGAVDYVVKPFQIDEVMARVHLHLRISETQHRLIKQNAQLQQTIDTHRHLDANLCLSKFSADNASEPILWLTSEGNIVYINDAGCSLLKNEREELLSLHFFDIDANSKIQNWPECWFRIKTQHTHTTETMMQAKGGALFAVACTFNFAQFADVERVVVHLHKVSNL